MGDIEYKHVWKLGVWSRTEGRWAYWQREDKCVLCGMKRSCTRDNKKAETEVMMFDRSKQVSEYDPGCWGAKNPQ